MRQGEERRRLEKAERTSSMGTSQPLPSSLAAGYGAVPSYAEPVGGWAAASYGSQGPAGGAPGGPWGRAPSGSMSPSPLAGQASWDASQQQQQQQQQQQMLLQRQQYQQQLAAQQAAQQQAQGGPNPNPGGFPR